MANTTEDTSFTHDILGRYVCNTFGEAKSSGTFDAIIIGGGTFGLTLAQDLFERSRPSGTAIKPGNYRILVLEGGPFTLPEHVQDLPSMALGSPSPVQADPATLLDTPPGVRPSSRTGACPGIPRYGLVGWPTALAAAPCISAAGRPDISRLRWRPNQLIH